MTETKSNDQLFKELFKEYGLIYDQENKKNSDVFITKQFKIITRSGVDKIQAKAGIEAHYDLVRATDFEVIIKGFFVDKNGNKVQTFGSASSDHNQLAVVKTTAEKDGKVYVKEEPVIINVRKGNVSQQDPYLAEMAEKRCMARGVLKLAGLYKEGFFSEDEADVFSKEVRNARSS